MAKNAARHIGSEIARMAAAARSAAKRKRKPKKPAIDIGGTVRSMRQKLGLTTIAFAKKAKISQAQISRLENNRQRFRSDTLFRVAKALKVKPWVLLMSEAERVNVGTAVDLGA